MRDQNSKNQSSEEMQDINKQQMAFYEEKSLGLETKVNIVMKFWINIRKRYIIRLRHEIGIDKEICALHLKWMGDLSDKTVLDLGCQAGNPLSLSIAEKSKSYLGIDLSRTAIQELDKKLRERQITHAKVMAVDFLSPQFGSERYDVIYARAVVHHFKNLDAFINKLSFHLVPKGRVITYDPLQTSLPVRVVRTLYRLFQSNTKWEWPFTKLSFDLIRDSFRIVEVRGVMGYAKWASALSLFSKQLAIKKGRQWYKKDLKVSQTLDQGLWRCLQVTMLLEKL